MPGSYKLYHLKITDADMNMLENIQKCIELINDNNGFTVVGWYKRWTINYKSLISQDKNTTGYTNTVETDI